MPGSRMWIFILAIIGIVIWGILAFIGFFALLWIGAIISLISIFVEVGMLWVIVVGLLLITFSFAFYVTLIALLAVTIKKVKNNERNKGSALAIVVLCSMLLFMSIFGYQTNAVGEIIGFGVNISWFDLVASLLGLAIGIGSLLTLKVLANLPPKITPVAPVYGYGNVSYGQYQTPYQSSNPNSVSQYQNPYQSIQPAAVAPNNQGSSTSIEVLKKELVALKSLLDEGFITQEEYDKRKTALLEKLS